MAKRKHPRQTADHYLDELTLQPTTPASAEALGIVCGAPRFSWRRPPGYKDILEIVGPSEMLQKLNSLWGTSYRFNPYSGPLRAIRTTKYSVIEAFQKFGFQPDDDENTLPVEVIRDKVVEAFQTDFDRGFNYALTFREQFNKDLTTQEFIGDHASIIQVESRRKSRSLRPQDILPDTPEKAYAFGWLSCAPKIWFGLQTATGAHEVNIAGPEAWLSELLKLWAVNYSPKLLSQKPPLVYVCLRPRGICDYFANLQIVDLTPEERRVKMRGLIDENLLTHFDHGQKKALTVLQEATKTVGENQLQQTPEAFRRARGRIFSEQFVPIGRLTAFAWGILSGLKVKLTKYGSPTHFWVEIKGPKAALMLLQDHWRIEPLYEVRKERGGNEYHLTISSHDLFDYLKQVGFKRKSRAKPDQMRALVPEGLKVFFDLGQKLFLEKE